MNPRTCDFYSRPGGCRRGSECRFLHVGTAGQSISRDAKGGASGIYAPSAPSGVCRKYWSNGACHRGDACSFRHEAAPGTTGRAESPTPAVASANTSRSATPTGVQRNVPPGVCNFFWKTGRCKNEFDCRFRHEKPSRPGQPTASTLLNQPITAMALVSNIGSDFVNSAIRGLGPSEVQSHLVRFFREGYSFQSPAQMYSFLELITCATTSNKSWNSEDAQLLLEKLAAEDGVGIARLRDIFIFGEKDGREVTHAAGNLIAKLSFQRGYLKLFAYYSSDYVLKSTLSHRVNALYAIIHHNLPEIVKTTQSCMEAMLRRKTFADPLEASNVDYSGIAIFNNLTITLLEYLTRYKQAVAEKPEAASIVRKVAQWAREWMELVLQTPPKFQDCFTSIPQEVQVALVRDLERRIEQLVQIVDREERRNAPLAGVTFHTHSRAKQGLLAALMSAYIGPGEMRPEGPRHDNDFVDIANIRIAPTHDELVSKLDPFLPANIPEAPHPFPAESMERLLDIQFRLLREELTAPLRMAVLNVLEDLSNRKLEQTQLGKILKNRGGRYRTDSVMFNVYSDVQFVDLKPGRRKLSAGLAFDAPPGGARASSSNEKRRFWVESSGKRLMQGGLVALIWKSHSETSIHLGLIHSFPDDIAKSSINNGDGVRVMTRVAFFDANTDQRVLEELHGGRNTNDVKLMLEAPVMYEAIQPFLEALRMEPATVPFSQYLVHRSDGRMPPVQPPAYATRPGFAFALSCLLKEDTDKENTAPGELRLNATDPASVQHVRARLREDSFLDPSQSEALVDCLVREVSMCQGPPGTGKSFIGVQLLRVLLQSNVRPILLIAFTNHALDHLLENVLDANITNKIVRLGSKDKATEKLKGYSLDSLELAHAESRLDKVKKEERWMLKNLEKEIEATVKKISQQEVDPTDFDRHLLLAWPDHHISLHSPPIWVESLFRTAVRESQGWKTVGDENSAPLSLLSFWLSCRDLHMLKPTYEDDPIDTQKAEVGNPMHLTNRFVLLQGRDAGESADSDDENTSWRGAEDDTDTDTDTSYYSDTATRTLGKNNLSALETRKHSDAPASELEQFFERLGCPVPVLPSGDRDLHTLLADLPTEMWSFSQREREKIAEFWNYEARELFHETNVQEFERLRRQLEEAQQRGNELYDQARLRLLEDMDIIGCTTNGAAKLTALMKAISPRVIMVEEAGQVLEAHILASLVPSVQHLICIGDPLQLRPTLNNYTLSVDSRRGAELYKFDMSTMERLSTNGLPMSQLNVQRRMRPSIAELIRVPFLYPNLLDHARVLNYPDVYGMPKNIFFMTHDHKENGGGEESVSKHNTFEVAMIVDLVSYLIRQSPKYSETGSIVVLCAYLGQLVRLRDAFSRLFTVIIDERDQSLMDAQVDDNDLVQGIPHVERVQMNKRILLRTVDNYQGEEADIIVLSLVRNSGEPQDGTRASIGFLKSVNRTNVALSRARHGLYIFGNSENLASQSPLWAAVIDKLLKADCIGRRLPIICTRHPDTGIRYADKPGDIPALAPDGGCLYRCTERLGCGHGCPHKCHPDSHSTVICMQPCQRLCVRQHPCDRTCSEICADCRFPMEKIQLPCGHIARTVPCHNMDHLETFFCDVPVEKRMPHCEHVAVMACSASPLEQKCQAACNMLNPECGHHCKARCHECQVPGQLDVRKHVPHHCGRHLFCQHPCMSPCGDGGKHSCTTDCKQKCRQVCVHFSCKKTCGEPCEPCKESCTWSCPHQSCPVPCGSPCARLPCDMPCENKLACGHTCPSVCGEPCHIQICAQCTGSSNNDIVDLILQRRLLDIDSTLETLDERIITLECRHAFTVETLDGHCQLEEYYQRHAMTGQWLGLAIPDAGYKEPLTCPTCRAPITSPRYGRATKRADLDVLERNVAGRMSRSIDSLNKTIAAFNIDAIREKVAGLVVQPPGTKDVVLKEKVKSDMQLRRTKQISRLDNALIPVEYFGAKNFKARDGSVWEKLCRPLLSMYKFAASIVATRSAHVTAYEAAFTTLYRAELRSCLEDTFSSRGAGNLERYALQVARIKIGQARPQADSRFVIEAVWRSIEIRLNIAAIATLWLKSVPNEHRARKELWASFCSFIYTSISNDAERASNLALAAEAQRQVLRSHLYIMRAKFEDFRFTVFLRQTEGMDSSERGKLLVLVQKHGIEAAKHSESAVTAYRAARRRSAEDDQWIQDNFSGSSTALLNEWSALESSVRSGVFYQPVTVEDRMSIVKALDFSHVGHFYRCPNGHTYIITECGGAMQESRCPECDAPIGGQGHTLNSSNSRDVEMEVFARQAGAQTSPWA